MANPANPESKSRALFWLLAFLYVTAAMVWLFLRPLAVNLLAIPGGNQARHGFRVEQFANRDLAGKTRRTYRAHQAQAFLDQPDSSLAAFAVWRVERAGQYRLRLSCDDSGDVFLDGRRVLELRGLSADNRGVARLNLSAGSHFLVVHLFNGPGKGRFSLAVKGPGESRYAPPPPASLAYLDRGNILQVWRLVRFRSGAGGGLAAWGCIAFLGLALLAWGGRNGPKATLFNLALTAAGLALAAGLGEAAARIFLPRPQTVFVRQMDETQRQAYRKTAETSDRMIVATPRGWRNRPNMEVVSQGHWANPARFVYRTNSLGYRGPEVGPKKGTRILFLGDSITFGIALAEEQTFVHLVEKLARQRGRDWQAINAAVTGNSLKSHLAILNESGLALEPDVVVVCSYLNDFQESPGVHVTRLPGLLNRSWLAHHLAKALSGAAHRFHFKEGVVDKQEEMLHDPARLAQWIDEFKKTHPVKPGDFKTSRAAFNQLVVEKFRDWGGGFAPPAWRAMEPVWDELARLSREHGFKLLVVAFPVKYQIQADYLYDYPQRRLKEITDRLGLPLLDLLPPLRRIHRQHGQDIRYLLYDQCHPSIPGNREMARLIQEFLEKQLGTGDRKKPAQ